MISKIVIFDGECAFCNSSVLFVLKKSKKNDIYVCSSQSQKGVNLINDLSITANPNETLIYIEGEQVYIKSNAALQIAKSLKGLYPILFIFKVIPLFLRDKVYDFIARRRKSLIKNDRCSFELANTFADKVLT